MRLIDADALKNSIDEHVYLVTHGFNETEYGCTQYGIHQIIDNAPTIDAEPVRHGKWKQTEVVRECFDIQGFKTWGIMYMCESCGFKTIAIEGHFAQYKYCPNCGARMDEE